MNAATARASIPASGATALTIDDSATVIATLLKILGSADFVRHNAFDAEKGLGLIADEKPDLVFLDIVLPRMNGFNALRAIRKDASTQHIPVIMISGNEHATQRFYANRIVRTPHSIADFGKTQWIQAQTTITQTVALLEAPDAGISSARQTAVIARKELTAMGLQYFSRAQFLQL